MVIASLLTSPSSPLEYCGIGVVGNQSSHPSFTKKMLTNAKTNCPPKSSIALSSLSDNEQKPGICHETCELNRGQGCKNLFLPTMLPRPEDVMVSDTSVAVKRDGTRSKDVSSDAPDGGCVLNDCTAGRPLDEMRTEATSHDRPEVFNEHEFRSSLVSTDQSSRFPIQVESFPARRSSPNTKYSPAKRKGKKETVLPLCNRKVSLPESFHTQDTALEQLPKDESSSGEQTKLPPSSNKVTSHSEGQPRLSHAKTSMTRTSSIKRKISFPPDSVLTAVIQDGDTPELIRILSGRHGPGVAQSGEGQGRQGGVDVRQANHVGLTALHHAVLANNLDATKLLLCHGADVNAQDVHGFSPLHTAAACGSLPITSLLMVYGADVYSLTLEKELPIDVAKDLSIIRLLSAEMIRLVNNELWLTSVIRVRAADGWLLLRKCIAWLLLLILHLVFCVRVYWRRHVKSD